MITTSNIIYPKEFIDPSSRENTKFKYYKITPFIPPNKNNDEKIINVGTPSGRIDYISNSDKFINEMFNLRSFSDIISEHISE